ncbi:MAG: class I SAM-dependent methyltransferase [Candidatus Omnitrophota bacterium]
MAHEEKLEERGNIRSSLDYFLKLNLPDNIRILDIGCRYGSLIHQIYISGFHDVTGIDVCSNSVETGRKKYPEIAGRLISYSGEKLPFSENEFDVVLMFDVIEHIKNVRDFLSSQVRKVLRSEGLLIFQTPNKLINVPWSVFEHNAVR